ncbi:MAG: DNA-3-methyladenine glycosylase family protein [Christensenellales bacterium]|jgi:N-glycosylase/DNA lyase
MILTAPHFHLERTLACGQAFRWKPHKDGWWFGVALDKPLLIRQEGNTLELSSTCEDEAFWSDYFSLDRDYGEVEAMLCADPQTAPAIECSSGMRILRQDPYETLISFVLSQNNNVKRISGIIEKLCQTYGEKGIFQGIEYRAFPASEALSKATVRELEQLGTGYRAPYIIDCAQKVRDGYDLAALQNLPFEQAKKELMTFKGVGPKVAECVMLFSLGFDTAFPVDVWVKRISAWLYPGENGRQAAKAAAERFGSWAGAAQQYLFHYARTVGLKPAEDR